MKESYTYKPVQFFLATNLIIWTTWLIAAYFSYQPGAESNTLMALLEIIGLCSPLATGLWMIYSSKSSELKQNFYDKLFNLMWIRPWTIVAIFLIWPGSIVISIVLSRIFLNEPLSQLSFVKAAPFVAGIIPGQLFLFTAPVIEEIGWRGYGIDSLRGKRSFLTASLIFASLWVFWHGPAFFMKGYYHNTLIRTNPLFALNFVVSMFAFAVIANWLWYKNRGNILTAVLCHFLIDFQGVLQMGQIAKCIQTVVLIVVAVIVVTLNKKMFFENFPPQIGYFGK